MLTIERLTEMRRQPADVPCNGCTACCRSDRVFLGPADDPKAFAWHAEVIDGLRYAVLDRQADGACVYLTATGCGIHGAAPAICRRMDCRVLVLTTESADQQRRIAENPQMAAIYSAGNDRLDTLRAA